VILPLTAAEDRATGTSPTTGNSSGDGVELALAELDERLGLDPLRGGIALSFTST
jgi:hypothetical protein